MLQELTSSNGVVIVGGGFGGLTAALTLARQRPRPPIVLIEPRERFLFLPLLYELLSDELQSWEVAPAYEPLLSRCGINWIKDAATTINTEQQHVTTTAGDELPWSQLLLATGASPTDFGIPGVRDHALGFQTLEDVHRLRQRIRDRRLQRRENAALVIVGAGPTGVELACKLADLLEGSARVHLIELGSTILPNSAAFNRERASAALQSRDVTIHLETAVTAVHPSDVDLNTGTSLAHDGLIWTAGQRPNVPAITPSPTQVGGRLAIDTQLHLIGQPAVFAIGDAARCESETWPATAQVAMQQGETVARSIQRQWRHEAAEDFRFDDRGEMLSLGIGDAALTGMGITLSGPLAYRIRRATYLTRLPGLSLGLRSAGAWLLGR